MLNTTGPEHTRLRKLVTKSFTPRMIENTDQRSRDYDEIRDKFRPAHADYTYNQKYGFRDYRGGGRASARETAMRVAAGAIAKKYLLERYGILVRGYLAQLGPLAAGRLDWDAVETNPVITSYSIHYTKLYETWSHP